MIRTRAARSRTLNPTTRLQPQCLQNFKIWLIKVSTTFINHNFFFTIVNETEKGVCLLGAVAFLGLVLLFVFSPRITGEVIECPTGYSYMEASPEGHVEEYCVEDACRQQVKCIVQNNLIKRPDCVCMTYIGRIMCGIKGDEKTAVKSPLCTRHGQLDKVCGEYDSKLRQCVPINESNETG